MSRLSVPSKPPVSVKVVRITGATLGGDVEQGDAREVVQLSGGDER